MSHPIEAVIRDLRAAIALANQSLAALEGVAEAQQKKAAPTPAPKRPRYLGDTEPAKEG